MGQRYKTASGEIIRDEGLGELHGSTEGGQGMRLQGRIAAVHKPLVSASRALRSHVAFMDSNGGYVFRNDSDEGRRLARLARELAKANPMGVTPLYQENGVYNMYMKTNDEFYVNKQKEKNKEVNPLTEGGPYSSSSGGSCQASRL